MKHLCVPNLKSSTRIYRIVTRRPEDLLLLLWQAYNYIDNLRGNAILCVALKLTLFLCFRPRPLNVMIDRDMAHEGPRKDLLINVYKEGDRENMVCMSHFGCTQIIDLPRITFSLRLLPIVP